MVGRGIMKRAIAGKILIGAIAWIATAQASLANINTLQSQSQIIESNNTAQSWSEKTLHALATEFNCGKNYPQASQQNFRAATRYELAATLHHCLQAMDSQQAIAQNRTTLDQLQSEFRKELETLRGKVETLDLQIEELENKSLATPKNSPQNTDSKLIKPSQVKLSPQSSAEQLYFGYQSQADFLTSFQTQTTQSSLKDAQLHQQLAQQINTSSEAKQPNIGGPKLASPIQIIENKELDLLPNLALAGNAPSLTQGINPTQENVTLQAQFQPTEQLKFSGAIGYSLTDSTSQGYDKREEFVKWVASAQLSNFLGENRVGYLSLSQRHQASNNGETTHPIYTADQLQSHLQAEAGYKISLSKNFSITPGVIWLIQPDQNAGTPDTVISVIRTNFKF